MSRCASITDYAGASSLRCSPPQGLRTPARPDDARKNVALSDRWRAFPPEPREPFSCPAVPWAVGHRRYRCSTQPNGRGERG